MGQARMIARTAKHAEVKKLAQAVAALEARLIKVEAALKPPKEKKKSAPPAPA